MSNLEQASARVMELLDVAIKTKMDLASDEAVYDLNYISGRLAQCSQHMEDLSQAGLELTQISISVINESTRTTQAFNLKEARLKDSADYRDLPREEKTPWLTQQLEAERSERDGWSTLKRVLNEVRNAVAERDGTMKRHESSLRLHAKLYETKVGSGSAPRPSFNINPGGKDREIEI